MIITIHINMSAEPELKDKPAMIEAIPQADLNPKECLPTEEEQVEEG